MLEAAPIRALPSGLGQLFVFDMLNLVPILSTVLPIIAAALVVLVFSVNCYFKIRRKFPVNVNCWFCNTWTRVPYDDRDCFDCPSCLQYNGFTKEGDYNKIIPEQRDELMNRSTRVKTSSKNVTSNGLCALCNNNQQLKVFQLANFVPLVEENYDVEIEHFEMLLEKAYKLCKKCDRVLKKTIETQNAWIFGNHIKNVCNNGLASIQKISEQVKEAKFSILNTMSRGLSILFTLSVIVVIAASSKHFTKNLAALISPTYLPIYNNFISISNSFEVIQLPFLVKYLPKSLKIHPYLAVCFIGFIHEMLATIWWRNVSAKKVNCLLCWIILMLAFWVRIHKTYTPYILLIQGFCCLYLLYSVFSKNDINSPQKIKGKTIRKLVKNLEYTCTDFTDSSDFENISSSSKSHNSSNYLNKSTYSTPDVPQQTFTTASTVLNSNLAFSKNITYDTDLNKSLNNLNLGGMQFKSPNGTSSLINMNVKRPKPVLSPPKLQTVNSWVAGGFWRNADGMAVPIGQRTNLSRSSSESSGFGSQHNDHFAPPKSPFLSPEFDKLSAHSEFLSRRTISPAPSYLFAPIEFRNNTYYPNLQHNNMLLVQGGRVASPFLIRHNEPYQRREMCENWSDKINSQAIQSFRDLSLRSNN